VPGKPADDFPRNGRLALIPGYKYNGTPVYLSEWGGIAYIPEGAKVPSESWGYAGVEKTENSALNRLGGLFNALRETPQIIGHCYTQLTDVEQEVNGLMTYDRKPKFDPAKIKAMNDSLR
jgi:hypothetical protein